MSEAPLLSCSSAAPTIDSLIPLLCDAKPTPRFAVLRSSFVLCSISLVVTLSTHACFVLCSSFLVRVVVAAFLVPLVFAHV